MKITFNKNSQTPEVHNLGFLQTITMVAMIISGIAFWIVATVVLFDPIYK